MTALDTAPTTDLAELTFGSGIPGFPGVRRCRLSQWGGPGSPFLVLDAGGDGPHFVLAPPGLFFPDYDPPLSDDILRALGLAGAADAQVWVILTLGRAAADATANLLGPIVANPVTGDAVQAVLPGRGWPTRAPLRPAA